MSKELLLVLHDGSASIFVAAGSCPVGASTVLLK
jgi:hypothetical protein